MILNISEDSYVPTLAVRMSEMRGLEELPSLTKDRLCPIFLLAPWMSAADLDKALGRIEKAFPQRPFFLDLDRNYSSKNDPKTGLKKELTSAEKKFASLFYSQGNYSNWLEFIKAKENIHPCLQMKQQSEGELRQQIEKIQSMDKNFCVRIEMQRMPENLDEAVSALVSLGTADFVIAIDAGWVKNTDVNSVAIQMIGLINNQLRSINAEVPIIISLTTFPKGFSDVEGTESLAFDNRRIVEEIRKSCNFNTIVYGDWGSTRPRSDEGGGRAPSRVDYPVKDKWLCARETGETWNFTKAAQAIMETDEWKEHYKLNIWGEREIESTAATIVTTADSAKHITTAQKNAAARINIHLHRQAFYDYDPERLRSLNFDEPWEDY